MFLELIPNFPGKTETLTSGNKPLITRMNTDYLKPQIPES
jgi:hypothetical protein